MWTILGTPIFRFLSNFRRVSNFGFITMDEEQAPVKDIDFEIREFIKHGEKVARSHTRSVVQI